MERELKVTEAEYRLLRDMYDAYIEKGKVDLTAAALMELFLKLDMESYKSRHADYASWVSPIQD